MKKFVAFFMTAILLASLMMPVAVMADDSKPSKMNRFNVVFAIDGSGSLQGTDPNDLRFDAIGLFAGFMANEGNCVGKVVFGADVQATPMVEIKDKTDKTGFVKALGDKLVDETYTDIGGGLKAAVELLEKEGKKDLPSVIILLTDGNTDLKPEAAREASEVNKKEALDKAHEQGIQVYSVFLNANGEGKPEEMQKIADATGGAFNEVKQASDLQSVFDAFYGIIYSTKSDPLVDETVPESGTVMREFKVAPLGVEEVNVVVLGNAQKCTLTKPDKSEIPAAEMQDMMYSGKNYSIVKVVRPVSGMWTLAIDAEPGTTLKVFKVYNPNLGIRAEIVNKKDVFDKGDSVELVAHLTEDGKVIDDTSRYSTESINYKAELILSKDGTTDEPTRIAADKADVDGYRFKFKPEGYGTFCAEVVVTAIGTDGAEELSAKTAVDASGDPLVVNIGNHTPEPEKDPVKKKIWLIPFLKQTATIELADLAHDEEDDDLIYRVEWSSWEEDDEEGFTFDEETYTLTINSFKTNKKGTFDIKALDSCGASCTFTVAVASINAGLLVLIVVGSIAILAAAAIIGLKMYKDNKKFMGVITVRSLSEGREAALTGTKGSMSLGAFQVGATGMSPKAHFQASGKDYIYFVSPTPVYDTYSYSRSKQVKIPRDIDVTISTQNPNEGTCSAGITVYFESFL